MSHFSQDFTDVSVRLDGKASIEHQIDIHAQDLTLVSVGDFSLTEILQGLKYVLDYRISGGKMINLDFELMKRLLKGILEFTGNINYSSRSPKIKRATEDADLAFLIFAGFLQEVDEFRLAVGETNQVDLELALKFHKRCSSKASEEQRQFSVFVLGIITNSFTQFKDWKDLVKDSEFDQVEEAITLYPNLFNQKASLINSGNRIFPPPALYFEKNVQRLAEMYETDMENGLNSTQIKIYGDYYGQNKLPEPIKTTILSMIWTQLSDFMVSLLILVAIIDIAADQDYKSAAVLLIVVVINVSIGFWQELKATRALNALTSLHVPKATVIRNGIRESIDSFLLVPGDVVILEEGDAIPADLRLIEVSQLEVIESILTGETIPIQKSIRSIKKRARKLPLGDCKGNAFMTTVVAKGRGKGIVVRTGENTEIGKISKAIIKQPHQQTNLQKKLNILGKILVVIAVVLCGLIVAIGVAWKRDAKNMALIALTLAVSVIPEGLVAVVTITMAMGVRRMAAQNAIIRKLPSVETLGSVTVICSDKTGTLTQGKMGTGSLWLSDNSSFIFSESTSLDPKKGAALQLESESLESCLIQFKKDIESETNEIQLDANTNPKKSLKENPKTDSGKSIPKDIETAPTQLVASCMIATLCNNASVVYDETIQQFKPLGDPTEVAMIISSQKAGFPTDFWTNSGMIKLGEYPFDSDRKLMSSIYKTNEIDSSKVETIIPSFPQDTCFVFAKGAPEAILTRCTGYLPPIPPGNLHASLPTIQPIPLSDEYEDLVSYKATQMAKSGLRVLGLALRVVSLEKAQNILGSKNYTESECDLVFVGLIGLIDPPKPGVGESVALCKKAGIKVIMITGDHIITATSIANQIGIYNSKDMECCRSMSGYEIDLLSDEALGALKPFPVVFARVSPDNKLKIVQTLQSKGHSVAMTGDGVNDAPAIKKADVGVAMGIGGTEITKQAADIILADDNFSTIVVAVKEGRKVFDNIRKFAVYLLACNSSEIIVFILAAAFNLELPFTAIQILWANIIADIPPSLALGVEPFENNIMSRPPRSPQESVMNYESTFMILVQGTIISVTTFIVYILSQGPPTSSEVRYIISSPSSILYPSHQTLTQQQSLAFFILTSMQLFQGFLSKSVSSSIIETGITSNPWMIYAVSTSFILMILGFYCPGFNSALELVPLNGIDWGTMILCLFIQLLLVECAKLFVKYLNKKKQGKGNAYP